MTNIERMTGYKATDENMQCRGLQYVLGEWQEVTGKLAECENGLHFCDSLALTFSYYNNPTDRYFKCEAEDVLEIESIPGVVEKRVARRIRLIEEIILPTGHRNTGDQNTGDRNTGDRNTGHQNTGHQNTGYRNTGHRNTGHRNTGDQNTGHQNTGDQNTGDQNTGHQNTGDQNTGHQNTGDRNTGDWNACNYSSGYFNTIDQKLISFDVECDYSRDLYIKKFGHIVYKLGTLLQKDEYISVDDFIDIPNITQEKLDNLHRLHVEGRKNNS